MAKSIPEFHQQQRELFDASTGTSNEIRRHVDSIQTSDRSSARVICMHTLDSHDIHYYYNVV